MAENFTVKIEGIDALKAAFKNYPAISEPTLQKTVSAAQAILASHTNASTVPFKTGALSGRFVFKEGRLQATWGPTVDYAGYVEFGTVAHDIFPVNKQALYWPGARNPVMGVHHPGTKANPYMERIIEQSQDQITSLFSQALQMILNNVAQQTS